MQRHRNQCVNGADPPDNRSEIVAKVIRPSPLVPVLEIEDGRPEPPGEGRHRTGAVDRGRGHVAPARADVEWDAAPVAPGRLKRGQR